MKKLENSLYITREGAYLHKERETLLVEQRQEGRTEKLLQIPIHSIGNIFCFGNIMVSPQLMGFCGESGVQLSFFSSHGRFLARVVGQQHGNVLLRRDQFRVVDAQSLEIARNIIAAKITSSRSVLQRYLRNHGEHEEVAQAVTRLGQIVQQVRFAKDLEQVRGYEGEAASYYFGVFDALITAKQTGFVFDKRSRRPPKDPVNAMISFLYAILGKEISGALQGIGLDPQVGFLHKERPGRDSLALDLLEEMRAILVDRLVLSLINRQQVTAADFEVDTLGGVRMKDETRKTLFQAWQAKKQEEITHPFLKEKMELGLLPHVQAMLLARHIRGDLTDYPPYFSR